MTPPTVGIIGAGRGALALGIPLSRAGFRDFAIFDREDGVGGTRRTVGSNSVIFMLEAQARYVVRALKYLRRKGKTHVAVRTAGFADFVAKVDQWMVGTAWVTRCGNYSRTANGRVVTQWPRSPRSFWGMTRRFRAADFSFEAPAR
ncbi:hypothetical protein BST11_01415 [Mycobacterium alsense]|uniref:FAD-binding domain-containing protein n=1 Tax=Mycobacterium alsense TaxID=324058 RepID=A0ABX3RHQ1_9MYCO|nr:hypothetical protein BST11_01415 [Mycobacterium alsense]